MYVYFFHTYVSNHKYNDMYILGECYHDHINSIDYSHNLILSLFDNATEEKN